MRACVLHIISIHTIWNCAIALRYEEGILSKIRIELTPVRITCGLTDIIVISAPLVNYESLYYLYKPNGDTIKLDINLQHINKTNVRNENETLKEYLNTFQNGITNINADYTVFNVNDRTVKEMVNFDDIQRDMKANDYVIGPLSEHDHGNWVLSVYCKDMDEEWIELFQVITIEIIEHVPMNSNFTLRTGETFEPSFAFPIKELESCELKAPTSTFDRKYDRNGKIMDRCGFLVKNVTREDEGVWKIVGVGKIVYFAETCLKVYDIL